MSVAVSRSDGVTVLTLTSDTSSVCPPLCQLLGAVCYSPRLCSLPRLRPQRGGAQTALGALWIITGLLHIGIGAFPLSDWRGSWYQLRYTFCPVWLGLLFIFFGVCCVLTERYPRQCFVLLSGILNLCGVAMAITGIVLYAGGLQSFRYYGLCSSYRYRYRYWERVTTSSPSSEEMALLARCEDAQSLLRSLAICISSTLITLSVLNLCVGLSSAILSFKSMRRGNKGQGGTTALLDESRAAAE